MPPFTRPLPISSPKTQSRHRPNSPSRDRAEIRDRTITPKRVVATHPPIPAPIGLARCAVSIAFPGATGFSRGVSISTRWPGRRASSQTWNPRPGIPCKKPAAKLPTPSPTKSREISGDDVVVWLSDDGLAWNQIAYYLDGQQVSGAITTFGDEIVAVGLDVDKTTDIIWYSTDGED